MAQFQYVGRHRTGRITKGRLISESRREAVLKLREKGIAVTHLQEAQTNLFNKELNITIGNPVKLEHFVTYCRQFATLIKAGVSIVDSTKILAEQTESKALRKALLQVEEDIRGGTAFSDAAEKHAKVFPVLFINMIRASEFSGTLDESLNNLAATFEKQHVTRQKIKSALAYPIILAIACAGTAIYLLTSVVPTFASMFADFDAELPKITQFVMGASDWMQSFWWLILLFAAGSVAAIVIAKKHPQGSYYLDHALLKMPIFGALIRKATIARMARTLSSLVSSSVPILQAITIVEKVVLNKVMANVLETSKQSLERGGMLSEPFNKHWIFPPLVTQMVRIGEQTGSLDTMLSKVADFYETEVDMAADRLKSLIEPIMVVIMAGVVGVIVLSIVVPMFDIYQHVQ
ncbi:type II secretion system F family protein [Paenibacillus montanisoli]|uniref:Type II secretion system F family protein n=1 Tax=Paenibacillus montanisoli TaxID=2081970 RepID=A0A328TW85_9BACL|nr:type II secretion system F family protein [Paenibacillus montanisoli]RAP74749.1 type II secretion system F family protein [Paenibacillus montanisoli]